MQGHVSYLTSGRIHRRTIINNDGPKPGWGFDIFWRYRVYKTKRGNSFNAEAGAGYFYSIGLWKLGRRIPGPGEQFEVLGRYQNHAAAIPLRFSYEFNARNIPFVLTVGREWYWLPKALNRDLPRDHRARFGYKKTYNFSHALELGVRVPKVSWLDKVSVMYRKSKWDYWSYYKRLVGFHVTATV